MENNLSLLTFLPKERSRTTFEEKLTVKDHGTKKNYSVMFNKFERFCKEKFNRSMDEVIKELKVSSEDEVFDTLQMWINSNKNTASTVRTQFSYLNNYLHFRGIKLDTKDIQRNLTFPSKIKEERFPLELEHIQKIFTVAGFNKKVLYLCQLSSGMRMGELLQIRKRDLELDKRIIIHIPAKVAKFNKARTTFFSIESQNLLIPRLKKMTDDDFLFPHRTTKIDSSRNVESQNLVKYLEKVGLDMRYESTGYHKITTHSFRSYFITKISRHDPNFAKFLAGQEGYLLQYDRMTTKEKLNKYLELEPELLIFDQSKKIAEIEKLQQEKSELEKKNDELIEYKNKVDQLWAEMQRKESRELKLRIR